MIKALQWALVVAGFGALGYRLVDLIRSPRRPALWAMWAGLLMLALAIAAGLPVGLNSAPRFLIQHLLILGCLAAFEMFYLLAIYCGRRRPPSSAWFRAVMYAFTALMVLAWIGTVTFEAPDWVDVDYRIYPFARAAVLAYTAATAASLLSLTWLSWRWSRIADRIWLRRGLVTLTVGAGAGLIYATHHFVFIVLATSGNPLPYSQRYEVPVIAVGVLAALIGSSMPAWGPWLTAAWQWIRHAVSYRRLEPVWSAFVDARPEIRLPRRGPAWDMEFALYRRVIEIWDGRSRLCAYLDPALEQATINAGKARGLAGDELVAAVEADLWRDALRASAGSGARHRGVEHEGALPDEPETGDNLADAVLFLELIAAAWRRPPLVASPVVVA